MKKFIFILSCLLLVSFCEAAIITVDDDGPADFDNIQAAIDDANDGDTVIVADGTYTGDGNRDIDFLGKAITVRSENGPENCIIDCNGSETEPHRGFYFHNGEGEDSVVQGLTIRNGYGSGDFWNNGGAAIFCYYASPTITGNIFTENTAIWGGAIFCYESSPVITGNTFTGNTADYGGGIYCQTNSSSTISNTFLPSA